MDKIGIDNRIGIGPGIGYKFLIGPRHLLLFEIGADYTYEDYADALEDNRQFTDPRPRELKDTDTLFTTSLVISF